MSCNCYKLPCNTIISQAVTVVTVGTTDTLVIDLPAGTYGNLNCYNIIVAQTIPATATVNMPVAFSIGGNNVTVYPFVNCCGSQVTACAITTRTCYPVQVVTSATSGVFRSLRRLSCYPTNNLASLPVASAAAASLSMSTSVPTITKTKKEDTING